MYSKGICALLHIKHATYQFFITGKTADDLQVEHDMGHYIPTTLLLYSTYSTVTVVYDGVCKGFSDYSGSFFVLFRFLLYCTLSSRIYSQYNRRSSISQKYSVPTFYTGYNIYNNNVYTYVDWTRNKMLVYIYTI